MKILHTHESGRIGIADSNDDLKAREGWTTREVTPQIQAVLDQGGPFKWVPDDPENPAGTGTLIGPSLDDLKAAKIRELEAARWSAEIAGITLPDGKAVRTDKETQAELGKALGIIGTINPALEIDWKFPSGEVVHMDATGIQQIAGAVFTHVQATRTAFKDKAALVVAANTQADLDAINW